jgi:small subunit ribosomal protein S7
MSAHLRDPVISRLVNIVMMHGKKHAALRIVDECLWILKRDVGVAAPVDFVKRAIDNAKPLVELRRYKAGGRNLQVPAPCRPHRQEGLALRFIRDAFRDRKEHGSGLKLAREIAELESRSGKAFRRREEIHKLAEANRAYSHFLR